MGYYKGSSGSVHRMPDEYSSNWEEHSLGEYWDWWHLGHEAGYHACEWDNGLTDLHVKTGEDYKPYLERLEQENTSLKNNYEANIRVLKQEIRKELEQEYNKPNT